MNDDDRRLADTLVVSGMVASTALVLRIRRDVGDDEPGRTRHPVGPIGESISN